MGKIGAYKDWLMVKQRTRAAMVNGPSSLRNEIFYDGKRAFGLENTQAKCQCTESGDRTHDSMQACSNFTTMTGCGDPEDGLGMPMSSRIEEDIDRCPDGAQDKLDAPGYFEICADDIEFDDGDIGLHQGNFSGS